MVHLLMPTHADQALLPNYLIDLRETRMLTLHAQRLQRELAGLTADLDRLIDPEDIVRALGVTWEKTKETGLSQMNAISREITTAISALEQSLARYITYTHPLIEFTNYQAISEDINNIIAFIREMAIKFVAMVRSLAIKLKIAVKDAAAQIITRLSQLGMNMQQLAEKADIIGLIGVELKSSIAAIHPMLWDMVDAYSATGNKKLKEGINTGILSAADLVRNAEKTLLATADEYTQMAVEMADKVKSNTPGPTVVKLGVRLVLKDNAFDIQQRRFVAQGSSMLRSIGLHAPVTRVINSFANSAIESGEAKAKTFAMRQVQSLISGVLQHKRVPQPIADQAAGMLVGALV